MASSTDTAYFDDLLQRADKSAGRTQVTFHTGGGPMAYDPDAAAAAQLPPAVPRTMTQWVLQNHSVLGVCWHVDIENAFTKPLKVYFALVSVLLAVFLSLKIQLATAFADFCVVASILHAAHWLQRFIFYRFQDSYILWPFVAGGLVLFLTVYDIYCFATIGGDGLRRGLGVGIAVYIFGFMLPEAIFRAYRYRKHQREGGAPAPVGGLGPGALGVPPTEDYSTL